MSSVTDVVRYLDDKVKHEYLSQLSSRWSALLPRLAKQTRALQQADSMLDAHTHEVSHTLLQDFELAEELLRQEHTLYREGQALTATMHHNSRSGSSTVDAMDEVDHAAVGHLVLFLRSFVSELTLKETMLAHWRATAPDISADTLRVYAHAFLVHKHISFADVERLQFLLRAHTL